MKTNKRVMVENFTTHHRGRLLPRLQENFTTHHRGQLLPRLHGSWINTVLIVLLEIRIT